MSQQWSDTLSRMSKPELLDLARKYNRSFDKIENLAKLKKDEIKLELLMREEKAKKIWSGDIEVQPGKTRKKTVKILSKEESNDLIKKALELSKKAMKTKDTLLKSKLLKEAGNIQKQILKGL